MTEKQKAIIKIESTLQAFNKACRNAQKYDVNPVAIVGNVGKYEMIYLNNNISKSDKIDQILYCD